MTQWESSANDEFLCGKAEEIPARTTVKDSEKISHKFALINADQKKQWRQSHSGENTPTCAGPRPMFF
jgi:hypothetical protein